MKYDSTTCYSLLCCLAMTILASPECFGQGSWLRAAELTDTGVFVPFSSIPYFKEGFRSDKAKWEYIELPDAAMKILRKLDKEQYDPSNSVLATKYDLNGDENPEYFVYCKRSLDAI